VKLKSRRNHRLYRIQGQEHLKGDLGLGALLHRGRLRALDLLD
jgi:hypothetical protein